MVEAGIIALFMAKNLGYPDLAHVAALRSDEAARMLGDPVVIGKAAFARFHSTPQALESWDRSLHLAEETAPQRLRNCAPGREAVGFRLVRASTTVSGGRELRGMAVRLGVPH